MKLAVLSQQDPYDRMTFSGSSYSMVQQLEKYFEVVWMNPTNKLTRVLSRHFNRKQRGRFYLNQNPWWVTRLVSRRFQRQLKRSGAQLVFNIGMTAPLTGYQGSAKVITFADATMRQMIRHNYRISPDQAEAVARNEQMEQLSLDHSDLIISTSQWCTDSIIDDYAIAADKVVTLPVGANMNLVPQAKSVSPGENIRLLFVGVDPIGKGLDIAIDALHSLQQIDPERGYQLEVVGIEAPESGTPDGVIYHGRLDKNDPAEETQLIQLYRESDLFILPTRFDTIGIVFIEAGNFGLPILTCDTGGVAEYVTDGETGYLLSLEADGRAFAQQALALLNDPAKYLQFSERAVELVQTRYHWDIWGQQVADRIQALLD